jgi:hypothetical protein
MRTFCSNLTDEISTGVYACDVVLRKGKHDAKIATYSVYVDSTLDTGNPNDVVIVDNGDGTYSPRFKSEVEQLPPLIAQKRAQLNSDFTRILNEGVYVLKDTKNIKMDSGREDYQSMQIGLNKFKRDVEAESLDPATATSIVKDFDNNYHTVTISEWEQILAEMEDFAINLWQLKGAKQEEASNASSIAELNSITLD